MIFAPTPKKIRVMLTTFRNGLHSRFGGKVRVNDILPALRAAATIGIGHFEIGCGNGCWSSYFHSGDNPFIGMDQIREAVGPDADLQILTHSVCGVTLVPQGLKMLEMQARVMKKHGVTINRNFDFMNDVDNLTRTGQPIIDAGMQHQVCVAMMGLPYSSKQVHTPEFYVQVVQKLLESAVQFDSVCMKDASGTTSPHTCYETAKGLKKILPPEIPLSMHTHDTASLAIACYMAGIAGGVDSIDLSVRPLASGFTQPDIRSMWRALEGTGFSLDIDVGKISQLEKALDEGLKDYSFNLVTATPDSRVVNFPMPGDAIGPNLQKIAEAGMIDRYPKVLAEGPEVIRAGGAWVSAAPGSQHYWAQAVSNVLHGRWQQIDAGYGRSVLGYFGRPPQTPDPKVVRIAAEQLELKPFAGNPLQHASDSIAAAEGALRERELLLTEENLFLVAAAIAPNQDMKLNEGIRLLTGQTESSRSSKAQGSLDAEIVSAPARTTFEDPTPEVITSPPKVKIAIPTSKPATNAPPPPTIVPVTSQCTVVEGDTVRTFRVTIELPQQK